MTYSLQAINALTADEFIGVFGAIYEHSPWVAERAFASRPFVSIEQMLDIMRSCVSAAPRDTQLALIRAHPELQGKPATRLTTDSRSEQKSAGFDQCSPEEIAKLAELNSAYREKFGFPFIIAVRGLTRADIIFQMSQRLGNDSAEEFQTCLEQIYKIAGLRVAALTL